MPIKIPNALPATETLESENVFVMTETRAIRQDIRPLKVLMLNLMPRKVATETQIARLLANTPLQVELELMQTDSHRPTHVSQEHMLSFYKGFEEYRERKFDGMIITGAPIEKLPFEEVDYWDELCEIMDWAQTHVTSTLNICWGAQAALYHHYGIPKHLLKKKLSGVYEHHVDHENSVLFRGADDGFMAPHSRCTGTELADIEANPDLKLLATSPQAGVYALMTERGKQVFVTGHPEYDADTLSYEYHRDLEAGLNPSIPVGYFPDDDPSKEPVVSWRAHASLLYNNWLNYFVYQATPYDIEAIG